MFRRRCLEAAEMPCQGLGREFLLRALPAVLLYPFVAKLDAVSPVGHLALWPRPAAQEHPTVMLKVQGWGGAMASHLFLR